jgi:hypothetical protein
MRGVIIALAVALSGACTTFAKAEMPAQCRVVEHQLDRETGLPRVAKAIADKKLDILVIGAGSSSLPGSGVSKAYPARLQAALIEQLPGVAVKVTTDIRPGRTAPDAVTPLLKDLAAVSPALMIWQAGTVDAMRSIDVDQFSGALDQGIEAGRKANSDVILMNAQYSPRTESIIALWTYSDNMRWAALRHEIPLFDRFGLMKSWAELGTFDFTATTRKLEIAEQVHDCIGRLLADLVISGAKISEPPANGVRQ